MLKLNKIYFGLALYLFIIEVLIALYIHDKIIRPYIGDVIVVMLLYCFIKSFFNTKVDPTAIFVLIFAFGIETLQYFNSIEILGLQNNIVARNVIGTSFAWIDIVCYIVGIAIVLVVEKISSNS